MHTSLIVAASRNGVIGKENKLLWRLRADMKRFRRLTMGKPIIMGRKTFLSIGKPLDGRDNIIISRLKDYMVPGAFVAPSLEAGLALARVKAGEAGVHEVMVIGGALIYEAALPFADRIYFSLVEADMEGDAHFSLPDKGAWKVVSSELFEADNQNEFSHQFQILERI